MWGEWVRHLPPTRDLPDLLDPPDPPDTLGMTLDDQLKRAFDTLSDRLRAEVDRQVAVVMDDLAASVRDERERAAAEARDAASNQAAASLETALAEARDQAHAAGLAAGRAEGLEEGRRQGLDEGRQQGAEEGRQQGILEGRQQGVLHGREQAEREASETAAAPAIQGEHPKSADSGASERLAAAVGAIGRGRSLSEILDALAASAASEAAHVDIWLVRGPQLRRWRGSDGGSELALQDAGRIADAVRSATAVVSGPEAAVPVAMAGQVVAVIGASGSDSTPANAAALDVLAHYAARCLETLTAFKTARAVSDRAGQGHEADTALAEEDASARRYARLLVSEIKLYHEPAVVEGRRDRDLATRLGGEISRARVLYEERVPIDVRQRSDYFHDELVRTLANGDATLLQTT